MNEADLKRLFPNASASTLKRNLQSGVARLHPDNAQPDKLLSLERAAEREETGWHGPARRFEITFTVFALRPCDWDGWDCKRLQDWLVEAGIIPSDKWDTLSGRVLSKKVSKAIEERTEIEIAAYEEGK